MQRVAVLAGILVTAAACAPKTTTSEGTPTPAQTPAASPSPSATPTPLSAARQGLLTVRSMWNDPPFREGEKATWVATPPDPSSRFLEESGAVASSNGEAFFTSAGGTFLGNEVVRVPAGEFRARHAVLSKDGHVWHLYLVRTIPGGFAKVERFEEGVMEPSMIFELDDYTRLPKRPGEPAP